MRIRKVIIKNFTAHVNSTFNFVRDEITDEAASLVIVRAENGTGKTQFFRAIQWALWGAEDGLGKRAKDKNMFLSPEWQKGEIDIKVEVEYEIKVPIGDPEKYTLVRTATEIADPENPNIRTYKNERVLLKEIKEETGHNIIGEGILKAHFPVKLKDVFIMDGESTDNLLQQETNNRRKIKAIITNLLGIDNTENAIATLKRLNSIKTKTMEAKPELHDIASKTVELQDLYSSEQAVKETMRSTEDSIDDFASRISQTKEELIEYGADKLDGLTLELKRLDQNHSDKKDLLDLLGKETVTTVRSNKLAYFSLNEQIRSITEHLSILHEKGEIPKTAQPVLEECLQHLECVCGSGLDPSNPDDEIRIKHIVKEVDKHKDGDKRSAYLSETLIKLKDLSNEYGSEVPTGAAHILISEKNTETAKENSALVSLEKQRAEVIEKLENCDEDLVQELTKRLKSQEESKNSLVKNLANLDGRLEEKKELIQKLKQKVQKAQEQRGRQSEVEKEYRLTNFFIDALQDIKIHRQTKKRQELSDLIGKVFIKLIGSESQGMYKDASIDDSYTLQVHSDSGTHEATWFLNGASLRMLAVTFIWCVTKVTSDLNNEENDSFPRIFDTPTGMISGATRRSYYEYVCRESVDVNAHNQLVLLTTEAERKGSQDLLTKFNPKIITVSSNHMPDNNAHEWPETSHGEFLSKVCECDSFGQSCNICTRVAG